MTHPDTHTLRAVASRRWLRLACVLLGLAILLAGTAAQAHRPGESYIYLKVDDGPLLGEFHIRFSDLASAFDLDADGDGVISEAEVIARQAEISEYLAARLRFHTDAGDHVPVPGALEFFGPEAERQIQLHFSVPGLDPPPDRLGVSYRFLYDGADPAHVPMLLFKSNTRMRLKENEWVVSLVFGTGQERQEVSLLPPPFAVTSGRMAESGLRQVLTSPYHLTVVLMALWPCLWQRGAGGWGAARAPGAVATAALSTAGVLAVAFALGLLLREVWHYRLTDWQSTWIVVAAGGVLLADNLYPLRAIPRWVPVGVAGVMCGLSRSLYGHDVGIEKGLYEVVMPSFALGVFAGAVLLAMATLSVASIALPRGTAGSLPVRVGSSLLVLGAGAFQLAGTTL